jgi:hypothetical protein
MLSATKHRSNQYWISCLAIGPDWPRQALFQVNMLLLKIMYKLTFTPNINASVNERAFFGGL